LFEQLLASPNQSAADQRRADGWLGERQLRRFLGGSHAMRKLQSGVEHGGHVLPHQRGNVRHVVGFVEQHQVDIGKRRRVAAADSADGHQCHAIE
jgi:hypothetical protein